jgi:hypothetical protein
MLVHIALRSACYSSHKPHTQASAVHVLSCSHCNSLTEAFVAALQLTGSLGHWSAVASHGLRRHSSSRCLEPLCGTILACRFCTQGRIRGRFCSPRSPLPTTVVKGYPARHYSVSSCLLAFSLHSSRRCPFLDQI